MSEAIQESEKEIDSAQSETADKNDEPVKENKPLSKASAPGQKSAKAIVGDFEIDASTPLPHFHSGIVKAYRARHTKGQGDFLAYVSEPDLVPRHSKMDVYEGIINPQLCRIAHRGKGFWPPDQKEQYFLIYHDNFGAPYLEADEEEALDLKSDFVTENVLKPFVGILQDFRDKDFVHGNINLRNVFQGGDSSSARMLLGDCLATPTGVRQNVAYEPIDRGMTDPVSRGPGRLSSDIYAFGVLLAAMLREHDPFRGLEPDQIVRKKIELGSYAAVTGKERFTGPILELLRGVLHDDCDQRWTIDEILVWMDGRRLTPKQAARKVVAQRPIVFNNKKYTQPITLAMDIEMNPHEARRLVEDGELKNWFERAMEKPELYEKIESVLLFAGEAVHVKGQEDKLVSHLSMGIDPDAPIRFKGMRMHPDGIGSALAQTYVLKKNLNVFVDLINQNTVMSWIKIQSSNVDIGGLVNKFDKCRMSLRQSKIGFGLERCLYVLNPECRCLSDKLKNYYVLSPEDMLHAFEDLCQKGKEPAVFIDRHIAAFLSMKDNKVIDSYLADLAAPEHYKIVQGSLNCFALIQKRSSLPKFPGIASAFADQLNVVYKRYHDRTVREALKKNISRYAQEGDLVKMAGLLDNAEVKQKDFVAFKRALKEYRDLENEYKKLEAGLNNKSTFGTATGQEVSAVISSALGGLIILFVSFLYFSGGGLF